jgi:hypothetical protein
MAQQKMCKTKANVGLFFQLGRPSSVYLCCIMRLDNERGFSLSTELVIVTRSALFCDGPVKTAFDISKDASRDL